MSCKNDVKRVSIDAGRRAENTVGASELVAQVLARLGGRRLLSLPWLNRHRLLTLLRRAGVG